MEPKERALEHLMDLLRVEGQSGKETPVAELVRKKLLAAGCKAAWIKVDQAHKKIPVPFEMGNLIVKMPGTVKGPRLMFSGHLDVVPLCRGASPKIEGDRILPKGKTGLGGDNRTAVGVMISLAERLLKEKAPHPPMTLLFTVGEEIGLWGSRFVEPSDLGNPAYGFNIDAGDPNHLYIGAIGADRWEAHVQGISSHAGVHPEHGVSAALIASRAIANIARKGYFGKIKKGKNTGTSNIGIVQGGEATNQVTDYVYVKGESRSHQPDFLREITQAIEDAFQQAAGSVKNHLKRTGQVEFKHQRDYEAFHLGPGETVVNFTREVMRRMGMRPNLQITNGGLDANNLNAKGIPTVTLGAGQHAPHTVDEYVDIREYQLGAELAWRIVHLSSLLPA